MRLSNKMKLLIKTESLKYKTLPSYCFKCRKNTKNINPIVSETSNGKTMLLKKCAKRDSKNQDLLKNKKQVEY